MSSTKTDELIARMPDLDPDGKLTGPQWSAAQEIYDQVLEAAPSSLIEIIGMLVPPGEGTDIKPRYVLHGLAVYLCRPNLKPQRDAFVETLASQLGGERPAPVQTFLIRQLQVVGGMQATRKLGELLLDDALFEPAAQALLAISDGAAEQFRNALPRAQDGARLTITQALGVLRDESSVDALIEIAVDSDQDVRMAAVWALANIGSASAVDAVLKAADAEQPYERIKATKACLLLAGKLLATGNDAPARRIYTHLQITHTDDSEAYVRQVAERNLAAMAG